MAIARHTYGISDLAKTLSESMQSAMEKEIEREIHNRIDPIITAAAKKMAVRVRAVVTEYYNDKRGYGPELVLRVNDKDVKVDE